MATPRLFFPFKNKSSILFTFYFSKLRDKVTEMNGRLLGSIVGKKNDEIC